MKTDKPDGYGVVCRKNPGQYLVVAESGEIPCALSSMLRKELVHPTADMRGRRTRVQQVREIKHVDPVAVGDTVRFVHAGDGTGMIVEVLPRRSRLARPASAAGESAQIIAANIDQVLAVFSAAQPAPAWGLLDRLLVSAEAEGLPAVVCITKLDLARPDDGLDAALGAYERIGYPVLRTSAAGGAGIEGLRRALGGKTSVLVGKSGVGKTTLLNAVQPGLGLRVQAVSKIEKGRHTTTHVEMFPLDGGGAVMDTPGVRAFGLWNLAASELAGCFPEMRPYLGRCRFGTGCRHNEEPGCAVRAAVMEGKVSPQRYRSFSGLAEELR